MSELKSTINNVVAMQSASRVMVALVISGAAVYLGSQGFAVTLSIGGM